MIKDVPGHRACSSSGCVHCDLKPSNIVVTEVDDGAQPKIIDFGLARMLDRRPSKNTMSGTVPYLAPEQIDPTANLDTRTDVYTLGAHSVRVAGRTSIARQPQQTTTPRSRRCNRFWTTDRPGVVIPGRKATALAPDGVSWKPSSSARSIRTRKPVTGAAAALASDLATLASSGSRSMATARPIAIARQCLVRRHLGLCH